MGAAKKIEKSADAYRSIGETAKELGLPTHVLRYWESKFPRQVRPVKRADGRRLFRPADLDALKAIQTLVHTRGMTLKGAKALLNEQGIEAVLRGEARLGSEDAPRPAVHDLQDQVRDAFGEEAVSPGTDLGTPGRLEAVLTDLVDLKARLDAARVGRAA